MRPPSSGCTWRKLMSFSSVAEKSFTGIVTRPKEMAPFQIDRGMGSVCHLETVEFGDSEPEQVVGIQQVTDGGYGQRFGEAALPRLEPGSRHRFAGLGLVGEQRLHLRPTQSLDVDLAKFGSVIGHLI